MLPCVHPRVSVQLRLVLRIPEELLYNRIEDLIIIIEEDAEMVSDFMPMEIDQIEAMMQEQGLLQRYPHPASGLSKAGKD